MVPLHNETTDVKAGDLAIMMSAHHQAHHPIDGAFVHMMANLALSLNLGSRDHYDMSGNRFRGDLPNEIAARTSKRPGKARSTPGKPERPMTRSLLLDGFLATERCL